jgi:hypothetical protein
MPARVVLLALLALLAASAARAQTRPLLTEEASTGPAGRVTLEAGAEGIAAEPNFLTGRARARWEVPSLNLTWSPAGNVEIDVAWVGAVIAVRDPDFGTLADWGDATLRAKLRLLAERPGRPALAARFGVTLPQTSFGKGSGNGLGPDTLRASIQLLASWTSGRLSLHANAGFATQDVPVTLHEQADFLAYGLAGGFAIGPRTALVAEVAGLLGDALPGADEHSELRAGVRYGTGRLRWDAAVRRGLGKADGTWGVSAGVTWTVVKGRAATASDHS